jgi:hypothetical protein
VSRTCLYYRTAPETDRWFPGDHHVRPLVRRLVRGKPRRGGVEKAFINLCLGLDKLGIPYTVNLPFNALRVDDRVGVLGRGRYALQGYDRPNRIVAGIGLMNHPSEWPSLCEEYPVVRYLQHSEWARNVYRPYFGDRCGIWPVGIDTHSWSPSGSAKDVDILLYDKILWEHSSRESKLLQPIRDALSRRKIKFLEIRYGHYEEKDFRALLSRSAAMIFLCEHESQGLAYQECLSSGVPVLAWDQGWFLDPNRFEWGSPEIPATSVPYFDSRCGERFKTIEEFETTLDDFLERLRRHSFDPRAYILENLTLERCSQRFLDILRTDLGEG